MIRMCKNMSKWEIIMFWFALSRVHVWCEDDGSNQCLPPQCKLCMNVYFNNLSEIFVDVHVTKAFVLTSNVLFKNFDIMILRNSLHTCLLQIWDNFYTPNARWLAYCDLHILSVRSGRDLCSTIELFPSSGSHKHSTHFPDELYWSKVFLGG